MNLQKMMQQAQQMQKKLTDMQAQIEAQEFEGKVGGVNLRISGKKQLLAISIDESLLAPSEKEMLEDSIIAAFNNASEKADQTASEQMKAATSGMGLPPGMKLPF